MSESYAELQVTFVSEDRKEMFLSVFSEFNIEKSKSEDFSREKEFLREIDQPFASYFTNDMNIYSMSTTKIVENSPTVIDICFSDLLHDFINSIISNIEAWGITEIIVFETCSGADGWWIRYKDINIDVENNGYDNEEFDKKIYSLPDYGGDSKKTVFEIIRAASQAKEIVTLDNDW
ncbi:hypothetical protein [Oceanicoccus sp. KOV_DT_Chl]|uniref:hypothetical protein n=1 Tax=Oceanicoccus sp. KOV_DT_Chl TaxID=1904639 RepID=UPI000C7D52AB|nr:hypothetical protein [Oceanicoccus sp. KOV_DT_Chl]